MLFNGYTISTVKTYRDYFNLAELIDAVDKGMVFRLWIEDALERYNEETELLTLIRDTYFCLDDDGMKFRRDLLKDELRLAADKELAKSIGELVYSGRENIALENYCALLCMLLRLYGGRLARLDRELLIGHITAEYAPEKAGLSVRIHNDGSAWLYQANVVLGALPMDERIRSRYKDAVSASIDQDSGFLAFTANGALINGSALQIPKPSKRIVKVLLYKRHYALLFEDGTVQHNWKSFKSTEKFANDISISQGKLYLNTVRG